MHVWQATTPDAALQYLNEASYVVSGRLHGLILAAVAEKDYAGLVYDPKVSAFLLETGAPAFSFPIDQTNLLDVIQKRISVPPNKVQTLKNRAYEGVSWLQTQLEL